MVPLIFELPDTSNDTEGVTVFIPIFPLVVYKLPNVLLLYVEIIKIN